MGFFSESFAMTHPPKEKKHLPAEASNQNTAKQFGKYLSKTGRPTIHMVSGGFFFRMESSK